MSALSATDVELTMRRTVLAYLSAVFVVVGVVLNLTNASGRSVVASLVASAAILLGSVLAMAWRAWPRRARGRVEVSRDAIFFDGAMLVPRASLKQAYSYRAKVSVSGAATAVRVVTKRQSPIDLQFGDADAAARFLAATSQSASDVTVTFYAFAGGKTGRRALLVGGLVFTFALVGAFVAALATGLVPPHLGQLTILAGSFAMILPAFFARYLLVRKLVVGTDGLLIGLPFDRHEFHPFASLGASTTVGTDLHLSIAGQRSPRRFALGGLRRFQSEDQGVPSRALQQRLEEARRRGLEARSAASTSALLARGHRSVVEWMRDLGRLNDGSATFRSAALPKEELWKVLDDASASSDLRVGAAVALRHDLGADERKRFRIAASVSAAPALRKVFLALGADHANDEALEHAVAALDETGAIDPLDKRSRATGSTPST